MMVRGGRVPPQKRGAAMLGGEVAGQSTDFADPYAITT
jgi:hypothetical protein